MLGVTVNTLQRWDREGKIRCERTPSGRRRIAESEIRRLQGTPLPACPRVVLYARVSSHEQKAKGDLARQMERLRTAACRHGKTVASVSEVASGMNDRRRGLERVLRLIAERKTDVVLVEYADRLSRFGLHYLESFAKAQGVEIRVVEKAPPEELEKELVEDMIALVAWFAGKLYGMRSAKRRKLQAAVESVIKDPRASVCTPL